MLVILCIFMVWDFLYAKGALFLPRVTWAKKYRGVARIQGSGVRSRWVSRNQGCVRLCNSADIKAHQGSTGFPVARQCFFGGTFPWLFGQDSGRIPQNPKAQLHRLSSKHRIGRHLGDMAYPTSFIREASSIIPK